jgi:hypothetical protein
MRWLWVLGLVTLLLGLGSPALADFIVSVDENGHGTLQADHSTLPFSGILAPDPGPGGLPAVLTYPLPFLATQGDVLLMDGANRLDVIRFNGGETLTFYSDNIDGFDALGDTSGLPGAFYANQVSIPEIGSEASNGAVYTPLPGQPGFDPLFQPTYKFISDGTGAAVPEPASITLLATGAGLAGFVGWRRRKRTA